MPRVTPTSTLVGCGAVFDLCCSARTKLEHYLGPLLVSVYIKLIPEVIMQKILEDTQQRLKFRACIFRGAQLLLNDYLGDQ